MNIFKMTYITQSLGVQGILVGQSGKGSSNSTAHGRYDRWISVQWRVVVLHSFTHKEMVPSSKFWVGSAAGSEFFWLVPHPVHCT